MDSHTCETCGNYYENAFTVRLPDGGTHVFDCFECAIHRLAPTCAHCGTRVIGHGIDAAGAIYCCNSCLRMAHPDLTGTNSAEQDEDLVSVAAAESFPASDPPSFTAR